MKPAIAAYRVIPSHSKPVRPDFCWNTGDLPCKGVYEHTGREVAICKTPYRHPACGRQSLTIKGAYCGIREGRQSNIKSPALHSHLKIPDPVSLARLKIVCVGVHGNIPHVDYIRRIGEVNKDYVHILGDILKRPL